VTIDIILLVIFLLSAIAGWRSGAISMLLSVVVLIAAAFGASLLADAAGNLLKIGPVWIRPVVGFVFSFIVLLIAGGFIKRAIKPEHGLLRGLDGFAGAILGIIRGAIIVAMLLALLNIIDLPPARTTEHSRIYPALLKTSTVFITVLKPYIHPPSVNRDSVI
jgi:membrane protein required for colicin V production